MGISMNALCVRCLFDKHMDIIQPLGTQAQADAFCGDLLKLLVEAYGKLDSSLVGAQVNELYARHYGLGQDRYVEEKRLSNEFILSRMDRVRSIIQSQPDPVLAGLQFAILGNYLDFSALRGQVSFEALDEMLETALDISLDKEVYGNFLQELAQGKRLLYVTDNAGEIGFDLLLAKEVQKRFPHLTITFCVRGKPAHNDATREDAKIIGVDFPIVDTGNDIGGINLELLSRESKGEFDRSDVILTKGMGNVETLYGCGYNIYYAFLVKCPRFVEFFGKEKMTPMLLKERP